MPSPDSGTSTRTVESAIRATSSSDWPDADRLHEDPVEPGGIEQVAHFAGAGGEPAERAAGGHGADVDALVQGDGFHADAVAEQGAAGEGAGGIDRDDRDSEPGGAVGGDQALDQGGLPGARAGR